MLTPTPSGDYASSNPRVRVYPTPEGYVAIDFRTKPPTFSEPFSSLEVAATWCESRPLLTES
jgi:hypothetical protein